MPVIKDWLSDASVKLAKVGIDSAKLDTEIILANCLGKNRTYLHAHPEAEIKNNALKKAEAMIDKRVCRIPIAYIIGHKEFYGRSFFVNESTLIPRPESETIIEILKNIYSKKTTKLVDVGTGSGCLGITAKLEIPALDVTLVDISSEALKVAKMNAKSLSAQIIALQSDLLANYIQKADIIIANLPYVDKTWKRSPETNHEPSLALFSDDNGKEIIKRLFIQATTKLSKDGFIIIEADPTQHDDLIRFANNSLFTLFTRQDYIIAFKYSC